MVATTSTRRKRVPTEEKGTWQSLRYTDLGRCAHPYSYLCTALTQKTRMSLAKLTALSTQTLSLLLERQRLQSLSPAATADGTNGSLHLPQITRNLAQLRSGIIELESSGEHIEAVALLRNQHVRMRGMVGSDAIIERLPEPTATQEVSPSGEEMLQNTWPVVNKQAFTPYTDDPEAGRDPVFVLQEQQRLMDGACHTCLLGRIPLQQQSRELQTRTCIWILFHTPLRVSVTYQCRSTTSSMYTQACWKSWIMTSIILEIAWAELVNNLDALLTAQGSTVSGRHDASSGCS